MRLNDARDWPAGDLIALAGQQNDDGHMAQAGHFAGYGLQSKALQ